MSKEAALAILDGNPAPSEAAPTEAVTEAAVVETPTEPVEGKEAVVDAAPVDVVEPKEEPFNPKLAMIARKERDLVRKQQEWNTEKQDFQTKFSAMEERMRTMEAKETAFNDNPLRALADRGISYEKLTEMQINGGEPTGSDIEQRMDNKFKTWEQKLEEREKAFDNRIKQKEEDAQSQAVTDYKQNISDFVQDNADKYKLTSLLDKEGALVYETIEAYHAQHGKVLKNEEALDLVEKYYVGLYSEARKRMDVVETPKTPETETAKPGYTGAADDFQNKNKVEESPTLTNDLDMTTANYLPAKNEQERMKRAMDALGGGKP